jgi:hypothetical protein
MAAALTLLRYLWASPATLVGLALGVAPWLSGARVRWVDGVLELGGGRALHALQRVPFARRFGAITLGHVVLAVDARTLESSRVHERIHVAQYERWGVLFFPAYLGASAVQWLRGRDPYLDNPFERAAFAGAARTRRELE